MKYDVQREHYGDRFYRQGEVREADASSVTHLVRAGILTKAAGKKAEKTPENKAAQKAENKAAQAPQNKAEPKPENKAAQDHKDKSTS